MAEKEIVEMRVEEKEIDLIQWNFEELKEDLENQIQIYENYKVELSNLDESKKTVANLNKLKKSVNDERKNIKKRYLKPVEKFDKQIKQLDAIIDKVVNPIKSKIQEFEEACKERNKKMYLDYLNSQCEKLKLQDEFRNLIEFNEKWLNKTFTDRKVYAEIDKLTADQLILQNIQNEHIEKIKKFCEKQSDIVINPDNYIFRVKNGSLPTDVLDKLKADAEVMRAKAKEIKQAAKVEAKEEVREEVKKEVIQEVQSAPVREIKKVPVAPVINSEGKKILSYDVRISGERLQIKKAVNYLKEQGIKVEQI